MMSLSTLLSMWLVLMTPLYSVTPQSQPSAESVEAPADAVLPGFRSHVEPVAGGRIDWTKGVILAEGTGRARNTSPRQKLMALRAAELVAARNALAVAHGIRIDASGRVEAIRDGRLRVQGMVQGQRTVRTNWQPYARPPQARVTLEVPLWGAHGVGTFLQQSRQASARAGRPRIALAQQTVAAPPATVVFDARGLDVRACLLPAVIDTAGRVLFDEATVAPAASRGSPPIRYVEWDATIEPTDETVRVIKVSALAGAEGTELVVSENAAERLARDPRAVAALRAGRVYVAVGPRE
ncbi:MAG TPA: hypothetical protein PL151_18925 [Phycisphaerae bacterium]|nr:hypothetical protein [Phycisphaerae bacterium]HQE29830.1 hypothetical protein [Phycisphaerae bacterium]